MLKKEMVVLVEVESLKVQYSCKCLRKSFLWLNFLEKDSKDRTILIHGAGSGVGTSAIQLAKDFGMKVLATAGDEKKLKIATKLGAEKTVNYKTHDFSKELEGQRVNLILDCVGGSYWKQNMKVMLENNTIIDTSYWYDFL